MSRSTKTVPFFKPSIGRAEISAVISVMKSGWLTTGPEAMAFEREFADFLELPDPAGKRPVHTLSVNSATAGLHLALEAVGVGPGDLIAVPSLTFTATAEIVRYLGADPLFIDSESQTGNMDPDSLKKAVEKLGVSDNRVKAVIPVHLAGHPCDMKAIRKAIEGKDVTVVEDAAHAFPSETSEGMAGTLGDIGVFSFYATKTITTGEGGMVATRNPVYEARMRLMRLHGIDRVVWNRYSKNAESRSWEYDVTAPGFKYNMSDLAAAIGRIQLKRADNLLRERRTLAVRYKEQLTDIPDLELPDDAPGHAWHLFIIRTRNRGLRDHLADELAGEGIGTSVHFIPLHRMTYWKSQYELNPLNFPIADDLAQRSLSLPLWPGLSRKNQRRTIEVIRRTLHG